MLIYECNIIIASFAQNWLTLAFREVVREQLFQPLEPHQGEFKIQHRIQRCNLVGQESYPFLGFWCGVNEVKGNNYHSQE